ncbi:MAG: hypothetical protein K5785_00840 [Nitrosarchaeum sp.]|nr:hypothetical protein [Nitrosarchaeum sp.]
MGQGNGHAGTVIVEIETDVLAVTNLRQDQSGEITLIELTLESAISIGLSFGVIIGISLIALCRAVEEDN